MIWSQLRYGQVPTHNFKYDAYISHSLAEIPWIESALLPTLEQTYGYKLCVPDRDFGGSTQIEESVDAMTTSRCIILVLSPSYLTGCSMKFDLDLAFGLCRENNTKLLFVGYGHLNPDLLKPLRKVAQLIRSGQVTEWPLNQAECHGHTSSRLAKKRQVFWDTLTSQLQWSPPKVTT